MAGRGPAPKLPGERRGRAPLARGEWVVLPSEPFDGPRPKTPSGLSAQSRRWWGLWWGSPMAHMWDASDWPRLVDAIVLQDLVDRRLAAGEVGGLASLMGELRHLLDGLGLSEKGRRDLRWRLPSGVEPLAAVEELPRRRVLAVDPGAV